MEALDVVTSGIEDGSNKENNNSSPNTEPLTKETDSSENPNEMKKRKCRLNNINAKLEELGFPASKETGNCVRNAIYHEYVDFSGSPSDLDQVVYSDTLNCGHVANATIRDLLKQPDWGGNDYDEGLEGATVSCPTCDPDSDDSDFDENYGNNRTYVTGACRGTPRFDSGKSHNHCTKCPLFGECIGDYRFSHCSRCDEHYYRGLGGLFKCSNTSNCGGRSSDEEGKSSTEESSDSSIEEHSDENSDENSEEGYESSGNPGDDCRVV